MRRGADYFIELLCWIAFLHSLLIAFISGDSLWALIQKDPTMAAQKLHEVLKSLIPVEWTWIDPWIVPLLAVIAAMSLLIGFFFLSKVIILHRERQRIVHEGSRGYIHISLTAIRSFIERLLINEFGLRKFRVFLHQTAQGLDVRIRATVPVGRNVLQTGERMQQIVQERVEEKLGVKVKQIEIVAQGVVGEGETEEDEEGARLYTSGGELD
ncbi:alkaline shock response membrane anchor protein AmaP [Candidatus Acetothermia bacterium]|nr:alkaline shock response membrane anchor protein AmaP [Candidatus Acetothermia bacterium]MBI3460858.1 alkaline shock response membrane anchor protein AmaP [Candidatus Acetothermia bacterium]MBI3660912.1 alkaline shock response membrane anchor protein AmaP [Candidatus Acetothermia bacterium]